jgi:cytochrome c-type biogenesis protein CcsB
MALLIALAAGQVRLLAIDQAKPDEAGRAAGGADPHAGLFGAGAGAGRGMTEREALAALYQKQDRTAFERGIALDEFRLLPIVHDDQLKIIDSWARQSLGKIRNRQTIDGKDPVYVALDMALRPEAWVDRNIIYVQAIPVREKLAAFASGVADGGEPSKEKLKEADRIMHEGLVSPTFLLQRPALEILEAMSHDTSKASAVGKVYAGLETFVGLGQTLNFLPPPPAQRGSPWINPKQVVDADAPPATRPVGPMMKAPAPPPPSPYTAEQNLKIKLAFQQLGAGWQGDDVELANTALANFVAVARGIDPEHTMTRTRQVAELWYNKSFNGTIVAFVYFVAMTLFLLVAVGVTRRVEKAALATFAVAVALHLAAMGVRWWLADRIPVKNQFESVMGSACIGCLIGLGLETWKRNGIFGVAFGFVGFLAMTTCLASPYVFGKDLGAPIGKVAGILDDAWLYIHVNIVIASYALIAASFVIGVIYLLLRQWFWVNPIEPEADGAGPAVAMAGAGGLTGGGGGVAQAVAAAPAEVAQLEARRATTLDTLDQANMVVIQMAFWFLGIGIICGAVWADHSWGRPWGWDPKETFALVTWIVYLIIVHLRFVTKAKADWSAWLAIAGFFIMMFNWVGVNFFLQGLHSYA